MATTLGVRCRSHFLDKAAAGPTTGYAGVMRLAGLSHAGTDAIFPPSRQCAMDHRVDRVWAFAPMSASWIVGTKLAADMQSCSATSVWAHTPMARSRSLPLVIGACALRDLRCSLTSLRMIVVTERQRRSFSGLAVTLAIVLLLALGAWGFNQQASWAIIPCGMAIAIGAGLYAVEPNQAVVCTFFGQYAGTVQQPGLRWSNPLLRKTKVSLRLRIFESHLIKVNEREGSPIQIAAVIVWQVTEPSLALFGVEALEHYVHTQAESALRNLAARYPYDAPDPKTQSLRSHVNEIAGQLRDDLVEPMRAAGVGVRQARISHLAYAPEIAQAMLQRQQAQAMVAARQQIVINAVDIVDLACQQLRQRGLLNNNQEEQMRMVTNLLTVLCGEGRVQPVIETAGVPSSVRTD